MGKLAVDLTLLLCAVFAGSSGDYVSVIRVQGNHTERVILSPIILPVMEHRAVTQNEAMERDVATALEDSCVDEFHYNRTEYLNIVNPNDDLYYLPYLTKKPKCCIHSFSRRVVLQDQHLSYFQETLNMENMYLYNGSLVQSFAVDYQAKFITDCKNNSDICFVTVPCLVPKMVVRYEYEWHFGGGAITGFTGWVITDMPNNVKVTISKRANRLCFISDAFSWGLIKHLTKTWYLTVSRPQYFYYAQDFLSKHFLETKRLDIKYKDEVRDFVIRIVREAFSQTTNVFSPLEDLHQFCDQLVAPTNYVIPGDNNQTDSATVETCEYNNTDTTTVESKEHNKTSSTSFTIEANSTGDDYRRNIKITTNIKNNTDNINIGLNNNINVNINVILPNTTMATTTPPPFYNKDTASTFLQLLKTLNYTVNQLISKPRKT